MGRVSFGGVERVKEESRDERGIRLKVVILSYGLWQKRFGGDPEVIGKEILLNDQRRAVVGILPPGFQFLGKDTNLWAPIAFSKEDLANRGYHYLTVIGRMKSGVTLAQANADIDAIMWRISRDDPSVGVEHGSVVIPLREQLAGKVRSELILLLGAVGLVLVIACANVANLLLSRGAARYQEIALRAALGAGRGRIIRQLLTESMLLAVVGSAAGLLAARWSFSFLGRLVPESMSLTAGLKLDARVLLFTLALSFLAGVIFGAAPAAQAARLDLNEVLKQGGSRAGNSSGGLRLRGALVVTEFTLALVILVGAGLLIKSFFRLRTMDIGFRPENVLTVRTTLPPSRYADLPRRMAFYQQVLERVRALPGVSSAGYTTVVPMIWKGGSNGFSVEGRSQSPGQDANHRQVSPGYMETMGMTLIQGRFFNEQDGPQSQPVAIINETMARQLWSGENALGRRFKIGSIDSNSSWFTIVGVVGDIKEMGLEAPVKAEMYFSPSQMAGHDLYAPSEMAIRTASDPMSLAAAVRQAVWSVDPNQPVSNIRTMAEILGNEMLRRQIGANLLGAFAGLALLLASLGVYGVLSYNIALRRQEIGIRLALGAQRRDVLKLLIWQGMRLTLAGVVIGLIGSFTLTRLMQGFLYDVSAVDPLTFALVTVLLTVVALAACWIPARRATKVDPLRALRRE